MLTANDVGLTAEIASRFAVDGTLAETVAYGGGHINDTFLATFTHAQSPPQRIIFQRINQYVFPDPIGLMANFCAVTAHLRRRLLQDGAMEIERRVLCHVPTKLGDTHAILPNGDFWRATYFVERTCTFQSITNPEQLYTAGRAFGNFQNQMADLEAMIVETIADFHHTPQRFAALKAAIATDAVGRADSAESAIKFALEREPFASTLHTLQANGTLPTRIIHNDTKIDNVLFDAATGEALCVTDLDTVMPGLAGYDFGELVRSGVSVSAEDEQDLARVKVDFGRFEQIAAGYLSATRDMLTPAERDHLLTAAQMMTFENGIRFLTDYLQGDVYFKTSRPAQNLDRCRAQFALLRSLETHAETLQEIIACA